MLAEEPVLSLTKAWTESVGENHSEDPHYLLSGIFLWCCKQQKSKQKEDKTDCLAGKNRVQEFHCIPGAFQS